MNMHTTMQLTDDAVGVHVVVEELHADVDEGSHREEHRRRRKEECIGIDQDANVEGRGEQGERLGCEGAKPNRGILQGTGTWSAKGLPRRLEVGDRRRQFDTGSGAALDERREA